VRYLPSCKADAQPVGFTPPDQTPVRRRFDRSSDAPLLTSEPSMADTSTLAAKAALPSDADIARAESFTREPYVYPGEERDIALAPGTPRRRALDQALSELDAGLKAPSPPGAATSRCCSASSASCPRTSPASPTRRCSPPTRSTPCRAPSRPCSPKRSPATGTATQRRRQRATSSPTPRSSAPTTTTRRAIGRRPRRHGRESSPRRSSRRTRSRSATTTTRTTRSSRGPLPTRTSRTTSSRTT
jgi:hypothetical protein